MEDLSLKINFNPELNIQKTNSAEKKPNFKAITQVAENKCYTDPTNSIKAQIGINSPTTYTPLGSFKINGIQDAYMYRLSNGQSVIIIPKDGPTVVRTAFNVGSMNEPDNIRGISHFIEHNLFNGSDNIKAGEFFKRVSQMGGDTNASTSFSTTDYFISSQLINDTDLETKIKLHADMIQHPKFDIKQIEKERGPVISEISMCLDNPENLALQTCVKNLFQVDSTSQDLIAGEIKNINSMTRNDVVNYYNTWYVPENAVTVVTGDVNPDEVARLLAQNLTKTSSKFLPRKYEPLKLVEKPVRKDIYTPKAHSATISIGFNGPKNIDTRESIKLDIIQGLLFGYKNARLNKKLEEIPTSASFGTEKISNNPYDPVAILITSQVADNNAEKTMQIIYDEISNLSYNPPKQDELEIAKSKCRQAFNSILEQSSLLNNLTSSAVLNGDLSYVTNYNEILNSITPQEISEAVRKYLDLSRNSICVVHPEKETAQKQVSFKGRRKLGININDIEQYVLQNNIKFSYKPSKLDKTTGNFVLSSHLPANVKPGVDKILSVMIGRGTNQYSEKVFSDILDKNCIDLTLKASSKGISAIVQAPTDKTDMALNLLKENILTPNFSKENFEYAKNLIKANIKNSPNSAFEALNKEFFPYHEEGHTKKDILDNIDSIKPEDVIGLHAYIMQNSSALANITASPNIRNNIFASLSGLPKFQPVTTQLTPIYTPQKEEKLFTTVENKNQAEIVKGFKFKTSGNIHDETSFLLMNLILGGNANSRLFSDLREKQKLAYRVRSNIETTGDTGVITLMIKTTTDNPDEGDDKIQNVKKSLDGFNYHIQKMCNEEVTEEELNSAKALLKTKILNENETDLQKTVLMADGASSAYGIEHTNLMLQEIDKITAQDIKNAAKYIFSTPSVVSIVASDKTLKNMQL